MRGIVPIIAAAVFAAGCHNSNSTGSPSPANCDPSTDACPTTTGTTGTGSTTGTGTGTTTTTGTTNSPPTTTPPTNPPLHR
jgi:hypothetical protein